MAIPETKIPPRTTRLVLGLFALAALTLLLAVAWLRAFVPGRGPERVRDRSWLSEPRGR